MSHVHGSPLTATASYYPDGTVRQWVADIAIPPLTYDPLYGGFGTPALPPPVFENYKYGVEGSLDIGSLVELHTTPEDPTLNLCGIMADDGRIIPDTERLPDEFADVIDAGGTIYFSERIDPDGFYRIRVHRWRQ